MLCFYFLTEKLTQNVLTVFFFVKKCNYSKNRVPTTLIIMNPYSNCTSKCRVFNYCLHTRSSLVQQYSSANFKKSFKVSHSHKSCVAENFSFHSCFLFSYKVIRFAFRYKNISLDLRAIFLYIENLSLFFYRNGYEF